jgi:hypothetical protein
MTIQLIDHTDPGFVGPVEIEAGLSMGAFLERRLASGTGGAGDDPFAQPVCEEPAADCVIRVNYRRVGLDYVLRAGDRVTITRLDPPRAA